MSGPVNNIAAPLQPVAHTMLQVQREIHITMRDFREALLWERPFALASPAFHLQHIPGVLDRLFTYAKPLALTPGQVRDLAAEGKMREDITLQALLGKLDLQVEKSLFELSKLDPVSLSDFRGVGRKQLPSTVLGLLFHAAEHSMRHTGQLIVTVACLKGMTTTQTP